MLNYYIVAVLFATVFCYEGSGEDFFDTKPKIIEDEFITESTVKRISMAANKTTLKLNPTTSTLKPTTSTTDHLPSLSTSTQKSTTVEHGLALRSEQKIVQIYKVINGKYTYLDASNYEVGLYIAFTVEENRFLNLIQYNLENEEGEDRDRIILRHELSLQYVCMSQCAKFYTSAALNSDCVFLWSLADEDSDYDTILLKKNIDGEVGTINFENGAMSFLNNAVLYSVTVDANRTYALTEMMDETNGEVCTGDNEVPIVRKEREKPLSAGVNVPILLICCTVVIVTVGLVFGFGAYLHHKKIKRNTF